MCNLNGFYQFLRLLDSRRSILGVGGTILRTLFGTATLSDLDKLHNTLDELEDKHFGLVHSLSNQIT